MSFSFHGKFQQNGTGVFHRLYQYMLRQPEHLVDSVEDGVVGVLQGSNAVMGGRETLYFNTRKFGNSKI